MPEYQFQVKQLVSYPRCRIYREFLQTLIADRGIRTSGCPGLFLCFSETKPQPVEESGYSKRVSGFFDRLSDPYRACSNHPFNEWF